jgi:hypothetical protein
MAEFICEICETVFDLEDIEDGELHPEVCSDKCEREWYEIDKADYLLDQRKDDKIRS